MANYFYAGLDNDLKKIFLKTRICQAMIDEEKIIIKIKNFESQIFFKQSKLIYKNVRVRKKSFFKSGTLKKLIEIFMICKHPIDNVTTKLLNRF